MDKKTEKVAEKARKPVKTEKKPVKDTALYSFGQKSKKFTAEEAKYKGYKLEDLIKHG